MILPPPHPGHEFPPSPPGESTSKPSESLDLPSQLCLSAIAVCLASILLGFCFPPLFIVASGGFLFSVILLAWSLTTNYWRPPHLFLWIPWMIHTWVPTAFVAIALFELTSLRYVAIFMIAFVACAVLAVLSAFLLRKTRADRILLISLAAPSALLIYGITIAAFIILNPSVPFTRGLILNVIVSVFLSTLLGLPHLIGLIFLKVKNHFGTTPNLITPHCKHCQYDLTGSVRANQTACPECGNSIPISQSEWIHFNTSPSHRLHSNP